MSKPLNKEPADKPAPIPPMSKLESDRKREIGDQVRAAVREILTKGGSVSAAQLTKWGPDGAEFFFRVLRKGVANQMAKILPPAPSVTPPKSAKARAENAKAKAKRVAPRRDASKPATALLPVSTDRDWTDQQRDRWSTRTRAVVQGLVVAAMLFVGAAVFTRLWGGLAPFIQQQIQNW